MSFDPSFAHKISSSPLNSAAFKSQSDQITAIYANNRTRESELISDLLARLNRPLAGKGEMQSIIAKFEALQKVSAEFSLDSASGTSNASGVLGVDNKLEKLIGKIQEMLSDGISSFGEIGQIMRLIVLAGGSIPPSLIANFKSEVRNFVSQSLDSGNALDAIKLLQQIRQIGGGGQAQEVAREVEAMVEEFLERNESQMRHDLMTHLANTASGKLEQHLDGILGKVEGAIGA